MFQAPQAMPETLVRTCIDSFFFYTYIPFHIKKAPYSFSELPGSLLLCSEAMIKHRMTSTRAPWHCDSWSDKSEGERHRESVSLRSACPAEPTCCHSLSPCLPVLGHWGASIPEVPVGATRIPHEAPDGTPSLEIPGGPVAHTPSCQGPVSFPRSRRMDAQHLRPGNGGCISSRNLIRLYMFASGHWRRKKNSLQQHVSCLIKFYDYYIWVCEDEKSISVLHHHGFISSELEKSAWWITE